jgi:hypothetical protein
VAVSEAFARAGIVGDAVRFGVAYAFLASAQLAPEAADEDFAEQAAAWFAEVDAETVVATMESPEFGRAFFEGRKTLVTVDGREGKSPKLLRFGMGVVEWTVFNVEREVVRGLWENETRAMLFFEQTDPERLSIGEMGQFLNNMIIQACDVPIGYPALTTPIIESVACPWTVEGRTDGALAEHVIRTSDEELVQI